MKTTSYLLVIVFFTFFGCDKMGNNETGTLEFKTIDRIGSGLDYSASLKSVAENPPLTGETTYTYWTSMKVGIGDVWISKDEVTAGVNPDSLNWVRLTEATNEDIKIISEYKFTPIEIEAGEYQSVKMTLKNIGYRYAQLASDSTIVYELLETMGSWTDPCNPNDDSWANTNYFGPDGNHNTNDQGILELVSAGEKVAPFTINEGKKTSLLWVFGGGATEPCINKLIDNNGNREWDCGIDEIDFSECSWEYMFTFEPVYEE